MRLLGTLAHKVVIVLIDSSSTHNFISEHMAQRAGLQPTPNRHLEVMVTSGEKLVSPGKFFQTLLNLQGNQIFYIFIYYPWKVMMLFWALNG